MESLKGDTVEVLLLERGEAAAALRLSVSTVRRLGEAGALEEIRVGRAVRVTADSVRKFARGGAPAESTSSPSASDATEACAQ